MPTPALADFHRSAVDDLLRPLHHRPYGAGWIDGPAPENRRLSVHVSMLPGQTPAAGLVLLRAGVQLNEPKYTAAAVEVARGVASSMQPTGQIPGLATFGPSAGGRDVALPVADRRATRAGLGLLLSVIAYQQENGRADERLVQTALRGAMWLAGQQSTIGGWPASYPPGKPARESVRLVLLNTDDFRDSTLALLLAGQILNKPALTQAARRSIDLLGKMQFQGIKVLNGRGLCSAAYNGDGSAGVKRDEFPPVVDAVASRRALETLLVFAVLTDVAKDDSDDARAIKNEITQAARTLTKQRGADGTWEATWDPKLGAWQGADAPEPEPRIFAATEPAVDQPPRPGTFGLPRLLNVIDAWSASQTGAKKRTDPSAPPVSFDTLPLDLAAVLTGLSDLPLGTDPDDRRPARTSVEPTAFSMQARACWESLNERTSSSTTRHP